MARSDSLILEVTDFRDLQHWRWVLKDKLGKFLQDQEVCFDLADPNYTALLDLKSYLGSHSSPDDRINDQLRLLDNISDWMGSQIFGKVADRLADCRVPTSVRVLIPTEASALSYLPLELARIGDRPLALRDLSLVFEISDSQQLDLDLEPIAEKLRMLAIFSLPTDVPALALRRERYELMSLISRIAQTHNYAIEIRVLQYGVTRDNLREVLEEGNGWDLIHISGHGKQATLILENPDGTRDDVSSTDLADLLSLVRGKLKLVTLSSCLSAAATVEETSRWLRIPISKDVLEVSFSEGSNDNPMPALAQQLVVSLDCAVIAMRYTVGDEFAIGLAAELYERLLGKSQKLPRALQLSLRTVLNRRYGASLPPLSIATPAIFGRKAADLSIKPPKIPQAELQQPLPGLSYFPDEPKRFVGRTDSLIRASAALALKGDKRGVLFYGMAGAGKTACALELIYHHSRIPRFQQFIWYKAPDEGRDIDRAMLDLARVMEKRLPDLKMIQAVDDMKSFKDILLILRRILEKNSILIVLDNLESLLTSNGKWRDERWGLLIEALLNHDGYSRTIMTSSIPPKDFKDERLIMDPIHALSLNESLMLALEMPNLRRMLVSRQY